MRQAVSVRKKMKKKKHEIPPHPKHTTKSTAARQPRPPRERRATKHVPRVSPYSPASIYPGFVKTGLVQLSQSVTTTNGTHTHTQTGRQTDNGTPYAPRYEETFWPIGKKWRRPLRSLGFASFKQKKQKCTAPYE